ncbi:phospholipid-translocating P-type ATPase [Colletotrichum higginsianum]|uniref:Phospholipid-transporting ATPase n=2 Tax=Colletotrichum higginsianum TaxID=80884 RepID=H1V3J4_COLHI|nr:Phospholipid-transporting ATPase [Colletotrichum higginsianum IMI 349063]OBR14332.1 Phospholipid-transporting ATPase [Colletotrichum higginsianum IMI 349063]TID02595.1 putative phospholipid-transporting ATPase DRS2 [Colletotrichum higginsianum]GJC95012.1 phospholipid-transporting ATPase [Colletotrichum higginsianum]CCF34796.1 phospholipid-translocating P-type ATPase [Colletotrichum higginsianum]
MAGRPTGGPPGGPSNNDLLLDLENDQPVYNGGQRSAVTDDDLLRYDHDQPQGRPSVSYDDFVGGGGGGGGGSHAQQPSALRPLPGGPTSPTAGGGGGGGAPPGPYMQRHYSQTSELNNYQRYADDFDDYSAEGESYYQQGGAATSTNNVGDSSARANARNRNSVLSLGGGFFGRMKNKLGMGQGYSEMDLPLTEPGGNGRTDSGMDPQAKQGKKLDMGNFKFGFGRSKPDPSTLGPRMIHLNNPPANAANKYVDNHISTAKYNVATFLPKFLFEQFSKFANIFFLFTAALQQIPNLSPTNRYTTIIPLFIVMMVSAGKELVEDYRRKQADHQLNTSKARVLRGTTFQETKWINVSVGDIIRVESEEPFPADLVLLASSEPEGLCYIETANLDGETNLKIKQALPETCTMVSSSDLSRLGGRIKSEQPNSSLYTYEATLTMQAGGGEKELPLNPEQLLLRGATLRNTPWIHGAVVFTGHETKLMRNATAAPIKRTKVEKKLNILVLVLVGILLVLSVICTVGDLVQRKVEGDAISYLQLDSTGSANDIIRTFFKDMVTYWVLFSSLVPISLFVTLEMVKYWHGILINDDLDIYYDRTDTPANCRTSSLVEELGMVEFVFSDKTGTLTCNMMEFKQASIGGIQYAEDVPEDLRATIQDGVEVGIHDYKRLAENLKSHETAPVIDHFLALLATCHTVIPERGEEKGGKIKYQAASPDEGALVEGAAQLGYVFTDRKPRSVFIEAGGRELEYELLAVCEFNSTRKRMSTIYRCPDGKVRVYCKGADTVILERLNDQNPHVEATLRHLEEYASEGLRTLCLAMREVPEQEFQEWFQIFEKAGMTVGGTRADELDKAAEIIERDFYLLGATAIEDRLQDGVPETIHTLQQASIKVWVLTGDRQETAINIGMSCKLLSEDMMLLIVNEESAEATRDNIQKKLDAIRTQGDGTIETETLALIIDGKSLTYALEKDLEKQFLDLAIMCKAVICCRVSPLQKALVVKLVKKYQKESILLAIGDGANDVSMIQAAHIGVGISGMEGLQAARSADVSIGQFRYLRKLLLVHGAWSYQRVAKTILFSFYKNITLYMTQFWYTFQNVFSGAVIYESWTLSFYNVFYTVLPPLALGILDQFISARLLDRYPQLYTMGQQNQFFKIKIFAEWVANAVYHSIILYVFGQLIWYGDLIQGDGQIAGHWVWGTALYAAVLLTVLGKAALITNNWTKYHVIAIPGSMLFWWGFIALYGTVAPMIPFSAEYHGVIPKLYSSPVFWLQTFSLAIMCLLRDIAWKFAKRMYMPQTYHHIQEIQKYNIQDYRPRMEQFQKAIRKVRQVQRMRKQRGYAFSQADESQTRVIQAYDTTQHRGRYGEMASSRPQGR